MCSRPFDSLYLQNYSVETFPSVQLAATIIAALLHSIHKPRVCNVWVMFIWLLVNIWKITFLGKRLKQIFIICNGLTKLEFCEFDKINDDFFLFLSETFCRSISDSGNTIFYLILNYKLNSYVILIGWFQGSRHLYLVNVSFPIFPYYSHILHTLINRLASFEKNKQDC